MRIKFFNSIIPLSNFLKFNITSSFTSILTENDNYILIYNHHTLTCIKQSKRIFNINYTLHQNNIKIDYLTINNDYYHKKQKEYEFIVNNIILNETEYRLLKQSLFKYIENCAIRNNINKIIIDTHNNLKRYHYELKEEGFIPTNTISSKNNSHYIEVIKYMNIYKKM